MHLGKMVLAAAAATALAAVGFTAEKDPTAPRVPPNQIKEAKAWKNPTKPTAENIAKGKEIFNGKGNCFTCHGTEGRGDGPAGAALEPSPRNFHNPKLKAKSDGELRWVIINGSPGTAMVSYSPTFISQEEIGPVIAYIRSLHDAPSTGKGGG